MSKDRGTRKMRWWVPAGILVVVYGLLGVLFLQGNVARYLAGVALTALVIPVLGLWYIWLTQLPWGRRWRLFGVWLLVVGGASAGVVATTRWEGSLNGGAVPRLVWKWLPKLDERLEPLKGSGSEATLQEAKVEFRQFLGPNRDGLLPGLTLDPDWESEGPRELWRREIGAGWSGFSVAEGRAVTQEQRGTKELVSCYDLLSGEPLWVVEDEARFEEAMGGDGPRANPTIFENRVYAIGATGILNCLDLSSGERIWTRDVLAEHKAANVMYGKACSPLVVGELVIVTGGKAPGPTVLAYHREKGELVWAAGEDSASYASPVVATLAGREQVVCVNQNTVTGHEIGTGRILWNWDWPARMPKSALAQQVGGNQLLVSASYGMGTALLDVTEERGAFSVKKVWKKRELKSKFSNVCIRDGHAFGLDEGRMACVEVATGKRKWRGSNYGYGQVLLVGDVLLVQSERGYLALVEASPERFREVARLDALSDKTWNNPALAGGYLLVRNDREAVCYQVRLK